MASPAAAAGEDRGTLYHLVEAPLWERCKAEGRPYFPPTYEQDGFIHLTKDPRLLLAVANQFYTQRPSAFLVLAIDPAGLTAKVVFEPAAPVGDRPPAESSAQVVFPHLYGTIDFGSVTAELPVERGDGGSFLAIPGLGLGHEGQQ